MCAAQAATHQILKRSTHCITLKCRWRVQTIYSGSIDSSSSRMKLKPEKYGCNAAQQSVMASLILLRTSLGKNRHQSL